MANAQKSSPPKTGAIGVVAPNRQELEELRPAIQTLRDFGCNCEILIASVWAAPERLLAWAERTEEREIRVVLATAGAEPQLPGFIAAACRLPVIALPLATARYEAARQMELAQQTSPAAPIATVAPGAALEAALLTVRILALLNPELTNAIEDYRQSLVDQIAALPEGAAEPEAKREIPAAPAPAPARPASPQAGSRRAPQPPKEEPEPTPHEPPTSLEELTAIMREEEPPAEPEEAGVEIRSANLDRPLSGPAPAAAPKPAAPARMLGRRKVDPDAPDFKVIEEAIDCLLEGGVIAFPTETVYGLAADATNPAACERLYELKGRPRNKAITLMVDSPKLLGHIACNLTVEARRLMEAFWPGPLTIIFQKRGANFAHISDTETIGVRLPDHSIPLSIMQALARPLACTSANLAGLPECFTADEVERAFPGKLNLLLDGGRLTSAPPSTVVDITNEPYRILRQGAVTRAQIAALVGDKMEPEA